MKINICFMCVCCLDKGRQMSVLQNLFFIGGLEVGGCAILLSLPR